MERRKEKDLSLNAIRHIAYEFRDAILSQNRETVTELCERYNPHYVHGAFRESAEYPGEVNVFRFSREISESAEAPFPDDYKQFLMRTVLG